MEQAVLQMQTSKRMWERLIAEERQEGEAKAKALCTVQLRAHSLVVQAALAAHDQQLSAMSQQLQRSEGETAKANEMVDWLKASLETAHTDLDAAQNKALQESSRVHERCNRAA